jgi:hypothetical protein
MVETPHQIMRRVARQYKFRARGRQETTDRYREALIAHAQQRDFAAAHEVRVGRAQAAWTPEDVQAFRQRMEAMPGPRLDHPPPLVETMSAGRVEVGDQAGVDAAVLELGRRGLASFIETRRKHPERELMLLLTMVLANGEVHIAPVRRGDRVAILKAFAQRFTLIGFTVAADVFIHGITIAEGTGGTTKQDAIMIHVGTHTSRWMLVQPYTVAHGVVTVEPVREMNLRDPASLGATNVVDPYAEVLCSVPMPTGAPS